LLNGVEKDEVRDLCMSDKAHFPLYRLMNKQNFHYRAKENCQLLHLIPSHSVEDPVWCAISSCVITDPHFLRMTM